MKQAWIVSPSRSPSSLMGCRMQTNMPRELATAFVVGLVFLVGSVSTNGGDVSPTFPTAKPIWPKGRETEMNLSVGFRAVIEMPSRRKAILQIAAATIYRAWVNGQYVGCGPARGPHGYRNVLGVRRIDPSSIAWPFNSAMRR